jgi:salicylate biosynthesis isochorismate synthase
LSIPAILLENIKGCCSVTLSTPAGRIRQAKADWLQYLGSPLATPSPVELLPSRPETLPARAWIARVNAALRDINLGQVDKLVLSRSRKFNASRSFLPAEILKRLIEQQQDSLIYAHGNGQQTFLGATPERLVSLHGDQISADALAGTALAWLNRTHRTEESARTITGGPSRLRSADAPLYPAAASQPG